MQNVESKKKHLCLTSGPYTAIFSPDKGMNLMSLKKGEIEAIDQTTLSIFEESSAGLGAMIGPHFHRQNPAVITATEDPFSHGIGRYAPWTVESHSQTAIKARLTGDDIWNDHSLKELEGQDFTMYYGARLTGEGLEIELSVNSETESVIGLHTYYALSNGKGVVKAKVQDRYNDQGVIKQIPSTWNYQKDRLLMYDLCEPSDYGFKSFPDPLHGVMELETKTHGIRVQYWCENEENSIQLWHPKGASFVCMEPLSATEPRKPQLTVSRLKILIAVLDSGDTCS